MHSGSNPVRVATDLGGQITFTIRYIEDLRANQQFLLKVQLRVVWAANLLPFVTAHPIFEPISNLWIRQANHAKGTKTASSSSYTGCHAFDFALGMACELHRIQRIQNIIFG
jgi:hypothetical protein